MYVTLAYVRIVHVTAAVIGINFFIIVGEAHDKREAYNGGLGTKPPPAAGSRDIAPG